MKGTFNQGWWNCFESFANTLKYNSNGKSICKEILQNAGITEKEATSFIKKTEFHDPLVIDIVVEYLNK